jgi:hypothetical protein
MCKRSASLVRVKLDDNAWHLLFLLTESLHNAIYGFWHKFHDHVQVQLIGCFARGVESVLQLYNVWMSHLSPNLKLSVSVTSVDKYLLDCNCLICLDNMCRVDDTEGSVPNDALCIVGQLRFSIFLWWRWRRWLGRWRCLSWLWLCHRCFC